ncbi:hypothetical protein HNP46_000485 [Pseudomonas nitritireducens]|uniref:Uncharacterized protein n=1 Tax=Pseudomonas nitroreducens TaxID=46680 RepID=A0A7W7KF66_PSENT|nr:hypothetical protein [Pseudomonas nitritireducens]MBB4861674.1 hypothetical protein [Pseudomonas nitritireducens]
MLPGYTIVGKNTLEELFIGKDYVLQLISKRRGRLRAAKSAVELNGDELALVEQMSTEDRGLLFTYMGWQGDVELCEELDRRTAGLEAPLPDSLSLGTPYTKLGRRRAILPYVLRDKLRFCHSRNEYARLVNVIQRVDSPFIFGRKSFFRTQSRWLDLLDFDKLQKLKEPFINLSCPVMLPRLVDRRVEYPGLLYGLESLGRAFSGDLSWYEDTLCWVAPEMLQRYRRHLHPLHQSCNVVMAEKSTWPVEEYKAHLEDALLKGEDVQPFNALSISTFGSTDGGAPIASRIDTLLLSAFMPGAQLLGLRQADGYVLCRTSTKFLGRFKKDGSKGDGCSFSQVRGYVPLELMLEKLDAQRKQSRPFTGESVSMEPQELLRELAQHPSNWGSAKAILGEALLCQMLGGLRKSINVRTCHMIKSMGLSTSMQRVSIRLGQNMLLKDHPDNIQYLESLPEGLKIFDRDCRLSLEQVDNVVNYSATQLTPILARCDHPVQIDGVRTGLDGAELWASMAAASSGPFAWFPTESADLLILHAGIDKCVKSASRDAHWNALRRVFGPQALVPYFDRMPDSAITANMVDVVDI